MPSKIYGCSATGDVTKCRTETRCSRFYCQINNLHPADLLCECVVKLYAGLIHVYLSPQSLLWSHLKCLIQLHRRILHLFISIIPNSSVRKFNHSPSINRIEHLGRRRPVGYGNQRPGAWERQGSCLSPVHQNVIVFPGMLIIPSASVIDRSHEAIIHNSAGPRHCQLHICFDSGSNWRLT